MDFTKDEFSMQELFQEDTRRIDYSARKRTNGETMVLVTCPACLETRWMRENNFRYRPNQTTYCNEHKWIPQINWAQPGEFDYNIDIVVDYSVQKVAFNSSARNKLAVYIWSICPSCKIGRYTRLNCIRGKGQSTTRCRGCASKEATEKRYNTRFQSGAWVGITEANGYILINSREVERRYGTEALEECKKYLTSHRGAFYEHRVVALLTYGAEIFGTGAVVRHMDGNRKNNSPENLLPGTHHENMLDHTVANREMKAWRLIALTLFKMLVAR